MKKEKKIIMKKRMKGKNRTKGMGAGERKEEREYIMKEKKYIIKRKRKERKTSCDTKEETER